MKIGLVVALVSLPFAAVGQSPSVDDLIRDLKPKADMRTRGIRPVAPDLSAPAAPAPMARPAVRGMAPMATQPVAMQPVAPRAAEPLASTSMLVQFESGSDRLTPSAMQELDKLGRALAGSELAGYRFRIEGHTDAVGSRELNAALSARRAAAVIDYIATHHGVDRSRLSAVGMGFSQMAVPTANGIPEPRNRRVQIINLGA